MKLGRLREYNVRNIFFTQNVVEKLVPPKRSTKIHKSKGAYGLLLPFLKLFKKQRGLKLVSPPHFLHDF